MNYLIGVDLGTSGTKTVLFDTEGTVISSATVEYPMYQPKNGWAEQAPEDWWDATMRTTKKVIEDSGVDSKDIKGMGISGQMHGLVMLDKDGKLPRVGRALMADAIGTVAGACLGTSTVTSYVESSAGVAEGGRTGLTSLTTAVMFILSLFLWPVFGAIPSFATAPALIIVGLFMMSSVLKVKFEGDMADVLGAFVAIIMMPFTYSIANGIMFGILTWMFLKIFRGKVKDIHPVMWVVFALFVLRIVTLCF